MREGVTGEDNLDKRMGYGSRYRSIELQSHRDARQFGDALHKSLDELKSILEKKE